VPQTYCVTVPQEVVRYVTTCNMVPCSVCDPCTGCCYTVCKPVTSVQAVRTVVNRCVPQVRMVDVQVCTYQRVAKQGVYTAYECIPVNKEAMVDVVSYKQVEKKGEAVVHECVAVNKEAMVDVVSCKQVEKKGEAVVHECVAVNKEAMVAVVTCKQVEKKGESTVCRCAAVNKATVDVVPTGSEGASRIVCDWVPKQVVYKQTYCATGVHLHGEGAGVRRSVPSNLTVHQTRYARVQLRNPGVFPFGGEKNVFDAALVVSYEVRPRRRPAMSQQQLNTVRHDTSAAVGRPTGRPTASSTASSATVTRLSANCCSGMGPWCSAFAAGCG
jgi:hypothetical protein